MPYRYDLLLFLLSLFRVRLHRQLPILLVLLQLLNFSLNTCYGNRIINDDTIYNDRFHYRSNIDGTFIERSNDIYEQYLLDHHNNEERYYIYDNLHFNDYDTIFHTKNIHYECKNLRVDCDIYAALPYDGCIHDPLWMYHHCPVSCNVCYEYDTNWKLTVPSSSSSRILDDEEQVEIYQPIRYNIPLYERFGIKEYVPHLSILPENALRIIPYKPQNGDIITVSNNHNHNTYYNTIVPQRTISEYETIIELKINRVNQYLKNIVDEENQYKIVRQLCRTMINHTDCAIWSIPSIQEEQNDNENNDNEHDEEIVDENGNVIIQKKEKKLRSKCTTDWEFMKKHGCYAFCYKCEYIHIESVCPIDMNEQNVFYSSTSGSGNDVNTMFTNIIYNYNTTYNITILSQPAPPTFENDEEQINNNNDEENNINEKIIDGPWILQIDDFLSEDETNELIELGKSIGYSRSQEVGDVDEVTGQVGDYISGYRTSMTAWCDTEECNDLLIIKNLYQRLYELIHIEQDHSESLQLLQYTVGQYYQTHHDYVDYEITRQQGVRIITVFIYLNTMPEFNINEYNNMNMNNENELFTLEQYQNNGGTNFPYLNITVLPKRGRVVIWPNVLNDQPNLLDERTYHQALVVTNGIKYGANAWYHQRKMICEEEE